MFPPRDWSLKWLNNHCISRFGVTPKPFELVHRWSFDKLVENNVTRILFTNGLKDGWSVSGIKQNLSDSLVALNFPNGAHHSDLSGRGPSDEDSDDIKDGFRTIIQILGDWLQEVRILSSDS
jgi:lysosomal Pro-X carboxypeptidase